MCFCFLYALYTLIKLYFLKTVASTYPRELKNTSTQIPVHKCSQQHNSQKVEIIQMSTNWWTNKMRYMYTGEYYSTAAHSSILAWRIPWTEETGRLQSMGLQRVRHDWAANTYTYKILMNYWYIAQHGWTLKMLSERNQTRKTTYYMTLFIMNCPE